MKSAMTSTHTGTGTRRSRAPHAVLDPDIAMCIPHWLELWGVPALEPELTLQFSRRLRRSLGRCRPDTAEIRLAQWLLDAPRAVLREVLCHEIAHAAVHALNGPGSRPHGPEWKALMRGAGFEPRVRLPEEALPDALRERARPNMPWQHACPVCGATRRTRRAMPRWRCTPCLSAGHDGKLIITRLASGSE